MAPAKNSFPYEEGRSYYSGDVRDKFCPWSRTAINHCKPNFFIIFHQVPKPSTDDSYTYRNYYDEKSGCFYFDGKGKKGDQTLTSVNGPFSHAKENNQQIHLFWQHEIKGDHEYIGQVSMEKCIPEKRREHNGVIRLVYVFKLKPIKKLKTSTLDNLRRHHQYS